MNFVFHITILLQIILSVVSLNHVSRNDRRLRKLSYAPWVSQPRTKNTLVSVAKRIRSQPYLDDLGTSQTSTVYGQPNPTVYGPFPRNHRRQRNNSTGSSLPSKFINLLKGVISGGSPSNNVENRHHWKHPIRDIRKRFRYGGSKRNKYSNIISPHQYQFSTPKPSTTSVANLKWQISHQESLTGQWREKDTVFPQNYVENLQKDYEVEKIANPITFREIPSPNLAKISPENIEFPKVEPLHTLSYQGQIITAGPFDKKENSLPDQPEIIVSPAKNALDNFVAINYDLKTGHGEDDVHIPKSEPIIETKPNELSVLMNGLFEDKLSLMNKLKDGNMKSGSAFISKPNIDVPNGFTKIQLPFINPDNKNKVQNLPRIFIAPLGYTVPKGYRGHQLPYDPENIEKFTKDHKTSSHDTVDLVTSSSPSTERFFVRPSKILSTPTTTTAHELKITKSTSSPRYLVPIHGTKNILTKKTPNQLRYIDDALVKKKRYLKKINKSQISSELLREYNQIHNGIFKPFDESTTKTDITTTVASTTPSTNTTTTTKSSTTTTFTPTTSIATTTTRETTTALKTSKTKVSTTTSYTTTNTLPSSTVTSENVNLQTLIQEAFLSFKSAQNKQPLSNTSSHLNSTIVNFEPTLLPPKQNTFEERVTPPHIELLTEKTADKVVTKTVTPSSSTATETDIVSVTTTRLPKSQFYHPTPISNRKRFVIKKLKTLRQKIQTEKTSPDVTLLSNTSEETTTSIGDVKNPYTIHKSKLKFRKFGPDNGRTFGQRIRSRKKPTYWAGNKPQVKTNDAAVPVVAKAAATKNPKKNYRPFFDKLYEKLIKKIDVKPQYTRLDLVNEVKKTQANPLKAEIYEVQPKLRRKISVDATKHVKNQAVLQTSTVAQPETTTAIKFDVKLDKEHEEIKTTSINQPNLPNNASSTQSTTITQEINTNIAITTENKIGITTPIPAETAEPDDKNFEVFVEDIEKNDTSEKDKVKFNSEWINFAPTVVSISSSSHSYNNDILQHGSDSDIELDFEESRSVERIWNEKTESRLNHYRKKFEPSNELAEDIEYQTEITPNDTIINEHSQQQNQDKSDLPGLKSEHKFPLKKEYTNIKRQTLLPLKITPTENHVKYITTDNIILTTESSLYENIITNTVSNEDETKTTLVTKKEPKVILEPQEHEEKTSTSTIPLVEDLTVKFEKTTQQSANLDVDLVSEIKSTTQDIDTTSTVLRTTPEVVQTTLTTKQQERNVSSTTMSPSTITTTTTKTTAVSLSTVNTSTKLVPRHHSEANNVESTVSTTNDPESSELLTNKIDSDNYKKPKSIDNRIFDINKYAYNNIKKPSGILAKTREDFKNWVSLKKNSGLSASKTTTLGATKINDLNVPFQPTIPPPQENAASIDSLKAFLLKKRKKKPIKAHPKYPHGSKTNIFKKWAGYTLSQAEFERNILGVSSVTQKSNRKSVICIRGHCFGDKGGR